MRIAVLAALAMIAQDVLGVVMVMAEAAAAGQARSYLSWRYWLAGLMDAAQWGVGITTTTISVEAFSGHSLHEKVLVAALVTLANVLGTTVGQDVGKALLRNRGASLADQVRQLRADVDEMKGMLNV